MLVVRRAIADEWMRALFVCLSSVYIAHACNNGSLGMGFWEFVLRPAAMFCNSIVRPQLNVAICAVLCLVQHLHYVAAGSMSNTLWCHSVWIACKALIKASTAEFWVAISHMHCHQEMPLSSSQHKKLEKSPHLFDFTVKQLQLWNFADIEQVRYGAAAACRTHTLLYSRRRNAWCSACLVRLTL
jgi:hypothetical protein